MRSDCAETYGPAGSTRREFIKQVAVAAAAALPAGCAALRPGGARRPNILFILADDLGLLDSGVYGSEYYDTPNIDRLAASGMRFTRAYAANPLCSPTRASILTGQYPARVGITTAECHLPHEPGRPAYPEAAPPHVPILEPNALRALPLDACTVAEELRDAGYRTGFIGKWHLGHPAEFWPEHQGFDSNIGGGPWPGPPSYHAPYHISNLPDGPDGEYITDRLTDETVAFLKENSSEPFFLALWHYAVHAPYQGKEELIERHLDREDPRGLQNNPVMAAMVRSLDESIGRILDVLDGFGLADNTVVIFYSDNGGNMYDRVGPEGWTPTNNAPLRSGKGSVYEGGVRVPLLVRWPGVVRPGSESDFMVTSPDFYPTLLDIARIAPRPDITFDGVSIAPLLRGRPAPAREAIFCHFPHQIGSPGVLELNKPCTAVWKGDWKHIRFYDTSEAFPNAHELYNLRQDPGESINLAGEHPGVVAEMGALIDRFLEETGALVPIPNPAYDPRASLMVDGWVGSPDAALYRESDRLRVEAAGPDPYIVLRQSPALTGAFTVAFCARSNGSEEGQVFWGHRKSPHFGPLKAIAFPMTHDGKLSEYRIPLDVPEGLVALRIDPGRGPSTVEFLWIRLEGPDGRVLAAWEFEGPSS